MSTIEEVGPEALGPIPQLTTGITGAPLDAINVSAWFGTNRVLSRVSLSMPPGTVTALIGPSGCGKSTFLRILNRMHETGALGQDGWPGQAQRPGYLRRRPARHRNPQRIGMVFQKPNPFPTMSIAENVTAG